MVNRKFPIPLPHDPTDEELVMAVLSGKNIYFTQIVRRYQSKLHLYLRHLIGAHDDAEDLLQNVFVKAYEHLKSFDQDRKFSSWIYRIAHNEAVNYLKKKSRRHLVSWEDVVSSKDKLNMADDRDSQHESWMRDELRIEVQEAMDMLPEKYREILVLRFYLDKSYAEMSQITSRPENTVATLLNRAKRKLLTVLNERNKL